MGRIDIYERFVLKKLSAKELSEFEEKIKTDREFAEKFTVFLLGITGIIKEANRKNNDLGSALKSISKDKLIKMLRPGVKISLNSENELTQRFDNTQKYEDK